jgi:hypothetical protein
VDHAQERDGAAVLGQDHRVLEIELDRGLGGDLGELLAGERVKRWPLREKARDLAQAGVQCELR